MASNRMKECHSSGHHAGSEFVELAMIGRAGVSHSDRSLSVAAHIHRG